MTYAIELGIILFIYLSSMVAVACYKKDTSIANFTWGGGVLIVTLYTFLRMSSFLLQQVVMTSLIILWAARLIVYVYMRYEGKDPRFSTWKWQGMKALMINIVWVFGQIFMIGIMSFPAVIVNISNNPAHVSLFALICGVVVWACGFYWEKTSDQQLFMFMRNPANKGHVLRTGLWKYSRHPNYFGESLLWHGIFIIALSVPYGWMTIIAPIMITFFLVFITGIPLLEKAMTNNSEYQEYKRTTSMFIPMPPKV